MQYLRNVTPFHKTLIISFVFHTACRLKRLLEAEYRLSIWPLLNKATWCSSCFVSCLFACLFGSICVMDGEPSQALMQEEATRSHQGTGAGAQA